MMTDAQGQMSAAAADTSASTAPDTTTTSADTSGAQTPDAAAAADGGMDAPAAYSPNFRYKFLAPDGSQKVEQEFDEFLRPVIKDSDTEKKLRDLYERAYGLDFVKADRQRDREKLETLSGEYQQVTGSLQQLGKFLKNKDYDSVFAALNVTEDDVLKHAMSIVQRKQMTPEQRAAYDAQQLQREQFYTLEQENAMLRQQYTQAAVNQRTFELDQVISKPEVVQAAQSFDARVGRPGAFRDEVIRRGQYYAHAHGQDIPAEQAVAEVLSFVGDAAPVMQQSAAMPAAEGQQTAVQGAQGKPVIPNIRGKGTSPTKRVPKSLADLRAMASEAVQ